jgi:hypothetical protein
MLIFHLIGNSVKEKVEDKGFAPSRSAIPDYPDKPKKIKAYYLWNK